MTSIRLIGSTRVSNNETIESKDFHDFYILKPYMDFKMV